jgi:hypothetical protein
VLRKSSIFEFKVYWLNISIIMRKIIFSFLLLVSCILSAQKNHIVVEGKVTDILKRPIAYATIQAIGTDEGTNADVKGHYIFKTTLPADLKASFIGYRTGVKKISPEVEKDTVEVNFVLTADSTQLQQVVITATHEPELIRESGTMKDFETNEHKLWLLYHYRDGDHLEIYDTDMKGCLTRVILKHRSDQLTKTPYNYLYIENPDSVRLFDYDAVDKSIDVGGVTPFEFHRFVKNLVTYKAPYYYYGWKSFDCSILKYLYVDINSGEKVLYRYKSAVISRQNNDIIDEVEGLNRPELDSNGMPEIIPADMAEHRGYHAKLGEESRNKEKIVMQLKSLFIDVFCPLRIVRDSIYIFNFDNDTIYVYNLNNQQIREMPLAFYVNGMKYKDQDILVNEEGNECYYKFVVGGVAYLQKIDLNNGTKMSTQKLGFAFPEKIRIMAGYAYYIYSDTKDNGMFIRHIYRQKL